MFVAPIAKTTNFQGGGGQRIRPPAAGKQVGAADARLWQWGRADLLVIWQSTVVPIRYIGISDIKYHEIPLYQWGICIRDCHQTLDIDHVQSWYQKLWSQWWLWFLLMDPTSMEVCNPAFHAAIMGIHGINCWIPRGSPAMDRCLGTAARTSRSHWAAAPIGCCWWLLPIVLQPALGQAKWRSYSYQLSNWIKLDDIVQLCGFWLPAINHSHVVVFGIKSWERWQPKIEKLHIFSIFIHPWDPQVRRPLSTLRKLWRQRWWPTTRASAVTALVAAPRCDLAIETVHMLSLRGVWPIAMWLIAVLDGDDDDDDDDDGDGHHHDVCSTCHWDPGCVEGWPTQDFSRHSQRSFADMCFGSGRLGHGLHQQWASCHARGGGNSAYAYGRTLGMELVCVSVCARLQEVHNTGGEGPMKRALLSWKNDMWIQIP